MAGVEQNRYKTNNGVLNICHRPVSGPIVGVL